MKEEFRKRGVAVREALIRNGDMRAMSDAKAWERDVIAAFPSLDPIGSITPYERQDAEEHVRLRRPKFSLTAGSTHVLTEGDIAAVITTVSVRLYRLHHGNIKGQGGRKEIDDDELIAEVQAILPTVKWNREEAMRRAFEGRFDDGNEQERVRERIRSKLRDRIGKKPRKH